jgi:hypothetical protein
MEPYASALPQTQPIVLQWLSKHVFLDLVSRLMQFLVASDPSQLIRGEIVQFEQVNSITAVIFVFDYTTTQNYSPQIASTVPGATLHKSSYLSSNDTCLFPSHAEFY